MSVPSAAGPSMGRMGSGRPLTPLHACAHGVCWSTLRRFVQDYNPQDPKTHQGHDLNRMPMIDLYKAFGLNDDTMEFVGHSLALHRDDNYLMQPALATVQRIQLYHGSLFRYEGLNSPYLYPRYGLGELPQVRGRERGG